MKNAVTKIILSVFLAAGLVVPIAAFAAPPTGALPIPSLDNSYVLSYGSGAPVEKAAADTRALLKAAKMAPLGGTKEFSLIAAIGPNGENYLIVLFQTPEEKISRVVLIRLPDSQEEATTL